jgi:adenylyltransferase/sulfurtransferase
VSGAGASRPTLSPEELRRYSRHLSLPEVGLAGQERLKGARVLLVGAGGLGSPLALYLAAAGVGALGLADYDVVDETNLQRQVLHGTGALGRPKTESGRERLRDLNPNVRVEPIASRLTSANALEIVRAFDVVCDGSDNFPTRYLVNDACVLAGKPNVYGSVFQFEGQASVFSHAGGPCYRCLYPEPPAPGQAPSCAEGGVLGVLPGLVGLVQATETLKLLLGVGEPLVGRLLWVDALAMRFREWAVARDPGCAVCGDRPTVRALIDYEAFCAGERPGTIRQMSVAQLKQRLDAGHDLLLLDVREPHEHAIARLAGSVLVPLAELPGRAGALDRARDTVVYCHLGQRSALAARMLAQAGFTEVWNLAGGIDAWSVEIDRAVPRY